MVRGGGSRGSTSRDDGAYSTHTLFGNFWIGIKQSFGICVFVEVPKRVK